MNQEEFIVVISTTKNTEEAQLVAEALIKAQVAACVSISSPIFSIYRWQGNIEREEEVMMFIKTKKKNYQEVERLIRENHSYEVPEILALPVSCGEEKYLKWISDNTL